MLYIILVVLILVFIFGVINTYLFRRNHRHFTGAVDSWDIWFYTVSTQSTLGGNITPTSRSTQVVSMVQQFTTLLLAIGVFTLAI